MGRNLSKYARKVDGNQKAIVNALQARGASVEPLSRMGGGVPDLLIGYMGINILLEVKDPTAPLPSNVSALDPLKLNPAQREWHQEWQGQVHVVFSPEDALRHLDRLDAISKMRVVDDEKPDGFEPPKEWEPGT